MPEINYISTSNEKATENCSLRLYKGELQRSFIREDIHSHPSRNAFPSGMESSDKNKGDIANAQWLESRNNNVSCQIYCPSDKIKKKDKRYAPYHSWSEPKDFDQFYVPLQKFVFTINIKR